MTEYTDLQKAAEYAAQDTIKFADEDEEMRALQQFHEEVDPETILALIADLDEARNGMKHSCAIRLKKRIELLETQRDQLIADNERLTKAVGLQVIRRFVGDDDQKKMDELVSAGIQVDKDRIAQLETERDQLKAENAGLRTGYEAYERVNAELKAEVEGLRESNDKLTRRNGMLEKNVEVMTETHVLYTWLRKKVDQRSNDVVAVHMNIGHDWSTVHDLDTDLRAMIEREEP